MSDPKAGGSDKRLKLHDLYSLPNITQMIKSGRLLWSGQVPCMGEKTHVYLVGKHEGKRLLGRPQHRWQYNIKMNLKEIGWEDTDLIHVIQHMDQCWAVEYREPSV
jgi:hypothetical protein